MPSNGAPKTVGDYVKLVRGSTYKGELVGKPGPPLLGLGSIEAGGGFRIGKYKTFGGECPAKWMVPPGSIYVALKGATKDGSMVGSVARLPFDLSAGRLTQDTARLDFLDTRLETANYLYWILRTPQYRSYCEGRVTGSASASFSREDFLNFPVPTVTDAAMAIVETLETVEQKIEQNRRTGAKLEGLARAVFKAWFVDFEPVKAKAAGATAFPSLPPETFAALPTRFEDSELGPVPEGWEARSLYSAAKFINGAAFKSSHFCEPSLGLPVVKIAELKSGITDQTKYSNRTDLDARYHIDTGDVLYSWSGSPDTSLDTFIWTNGPGLLNQHIFRVVTESDAQKTFVYYLLKHLKQDLIEIARDKQTTGLGHVTVGDMQRLLLAWPRGDAIEAFHKVTGPVFSLNFNGLRETEKLAALRDYLLPRLLSGRVRVARSDNLPDDVEQSGVFKFEGQVFPS